MSSIDQIALKYQKILEKFIPYLQKHINYKHRNICSSINNSKSINQYIENLTRVYLPIYLLEKDIPFTLYCGENLADTSLDLKDVILHLDNKGVEVVNKVKKPATVEQLKSILSRSGVIPDPKSKKIDLCRLIKENDCFGDTLDEKFKIEESCEYYEIFGDHLDEHLHFKSAQTNIKGYFGRAFGKEVQFIGKQPLFTDEKPHLTYILKHVYSKEIGIMKFVLYSIPHENDKENYKHIQCIGRQKRNPKSPDEFRFNMNDDRDMAYTFIGSDTDRYKIFMN